MIRILLVDDHPVLRHGTRALLESQTDMEVVGETGSASDAAALCASERVDVALVDLEFGPDQPDGAAAARTILRASPDTKVVAFTAFDADADIMRMIDAGAVGYLVKDSRPANLYQAIRSASSGATALAAPIAERLFERLHRPDAALTARELEVLTLAASGLGNRELAQHLRVSEATVKTHLHHAFTKLDAENRQAAIATAVKRGLIRL